MSFNWQANNAGYVQPPPTGATTQDNLYPSVNSVNNSSGNRSGGGGGGGSSTNAYSSPFGKRVTATATATGTTTTSTTSSSQKFASIGTLSVSDLKKQSNPLELASRFVDSYLDRDLHYPELDRIVMQAQNSEYVYCDNPQELGPLTPFAKTDIINIPDVIFDQYNQTESFTQMGLFPEIERAWITVDNRLYFWHYKNGNDFLSFEDLDKTILAVKLFKPRPGVFVESVNYLLALFTPTDAILLGVSYTKSDLQLFDTGMMLSTRGIDVSHAVSSDNGRLFFVGEGDGINIWELAYYKNEGWFRGKSSKICHTRSGIGALSPNMPDGSYLRGLVGSFMKSPESERIVGMEIDNSRNIVYTLSTSSTIRVYSMFGEQGFGLSITYTLGQLLSHLQMINANNNGSVTKPAFDKKSMKIVAIQPISKNASDQIYFIAITSNGCRLYVRVIKSPSVNHAGTGSIQVIQIRYPPPIDQNGVVNNVNGGINSNNTTTTAATTTTSSSKILENTKDTSRITSPANFFAVVPNFNETGDRVFVSSIDSGRIVHQMSNNNTTLATPSFIESAVFLDIEGYVQSIKEITKPFTASPRPLGFGNENAAQYSQDPPQVAILTNTGVHIYTRKFPYRTFEELGQEVRTFFELYGRTETCSSALSIASKESLSSNNDERALASRVFIEVGGKPHLKTDDENTFSLGGGGINNSNNQQTPNNDSRKQGGGDVVRLSGRFDGLATYVSRVVRDIWNLKVFNTVKDGSKDRFVLSASKEALEKIQLNLFGVAEFLEKNRAFIDGLSGGADSMLLSSASRAEELSLQAEHRGLDALVKLVKSIREGIAFLLLIIEETINVSNGIEAIMSYLTPEHRQKMSNLVFNKFFTTTDGTELAKELVTCLVNRSIAEGGSVDTIARILQDRCESYCSSGDVIIYKALEYLRKAKALGDGDLDLKAQNLNDSVRMFQRAAGTIHIETLKEAISEYLELEFYPGAVQVALSVAIQLDRGNLALGYLHDGKQENDARKGLYDKRQEIYQLVFKVLDTVDEKAEQEIATNSSLFKMRSLRDDTYNICFESTDEVFHYAFYDWFFEKGLESRLLNVTTPYVLPYLQTYAKAKLEIADLLWVYCQKHGDYYSAAEVLFNLGAKSEFFSSSLNLEQRIEFLSRGRGYCNCECPPNVRQQVSQLANSIQEYLDIASIQYDILRAIREDSRFEEEQRQIAIEQLDGKILSVSELFNDYADPLKYFEICLNIFQVTDFRGYDEITRCWTNVISNAHEENEYDNGKNGYEHVSSVVQRLGQQFMLAEFVFPTDFLVPQLETYALEYAPQAPRGWVVDTFINAGMSFESLYALLYDLLERKEAPFDDLVAQKRLAMDLLYLIDKCGSSRRNFGHIVGEGDVQKLTSIVGAKDVESVVKRLRF